MSDVGKRMAEIRGCLRGGMLLMSREIPYPFEISEAEQAFGFYPQRGFLLSKLRTCGVGHGCTELVFVRGISGGGLSGKVRRAELEATT